MRRAVGRISPFPVGRRNAPRIPPRQACMPWAGRWIRINNYRIAIVTMRYIKNYTKSIQKEFNVNYKII